MLPSFFLLPSEKEEKDEVTEPPFVPLLSFFLPLLFRSKSITVEWTDGREERREHKRLKRKGEASAKYMGHQIFRDVAQFSPSQPILAKDSGCGGVVYNLDISRTLCVVVAYKSEREQNFQWLISSSLSYYLTTLKK